MQCSVAEHQAMKRNAGKQKKGGEKRVLRRKRTLTSKDIRRNTRYVILKILLRPMISFQEVNKRFLSLEGELELDDLKIPCNSIL